MSNDVKIVDTKESLEIETISKDDEDFKYIRDAREARKNGEKTYSIDDMMKEFE